MHPKHGQGYTLIVLVVQHIPERRLQTSTREGKSSPSNTKRRKGEMLAAISQ